MSDQTQENLDTFTEEVRSFLADNLTEKLRTEGENCAGIYADRPVALEWLQILNKKGWAVPHWPVEYGGTGMVPLATSHFSARMRAGLSPNYHAPTPPIWLDRF